MQVKPHRKQAAFAILLGQVLLFFRTWLLMTIHKGNFGNVGFSLPLLLASIGLLSLMVAWGIYKAKYWAGSKFLLPFFLQLILITVGLIFMLRKSILLDLMLILEASSWIFALYHLAKVPAGEWEPKPKGFWKRFGWHQFPNLLLFVMLFEFGLNIAGLPPGMVLPSAYFKKVDRLIVREDYFADDFGITKINPEGRDLAATGNWRGKHYEVYADSLAFSPSTFSLYEDNKKLLAGEVSNPFSKFLDSLMALPESLQDACARAYLDFRIHPVNEDGFRSISFEPLDSCGKKKILLIGDSFTFGWSARPWTDAFADCLSAKGYVVYNAGITATDPAQYAAVARKYMSILQPDVVVVNFFLGNDIMAYPRDTKAGEMAYYPTNAGVMMAQPGCQRLPNADSAYRFYVNEYYVPEREGILNQLALRTTLGTLVWKVINHYHFFPGLGNADFWRACGDVFAKGPYSEQYLLEIEALADAQGADFICGVIPDMGNLQPDLDSDYPGLFDRIEPDLVEVDLSDYNLKEQHFNAAGHLHYASFLDSLIRAKMQKGTP